MKNPDKTYTLSQAVVNYLASLPSEQGEQNQQELHRFVRWYGVKQPVSSLTADQIANYADQQSSTSTDYIQKLKFVRAFLQYARKEGWIKSNLATHLKAKKGKHAQPARFRGTQPSAISLTRAGYEEIQAELTTLKERRLDVIKEMRLAAADKDFRENAPLQVAREERGKVEGRIIELEETLKSATVIDEQRKNSFRASIGDTVTLKDLDSEDELQYTLVSSREVDPLHGKVSNSSPVGKAIIGRSQGEIVEITVPAGRLRYQIVIIGR